MIGRSPTLKAPGDDGDATCRIVLIAQTVAGEPAYATDERNEMTHVRRAVDRPSDQSRADMPLASVSWWQMPNAQFVANA